MNRCVMCEKCHRGTFNYKVVIGTIRGKSHKRYYCNECMERLQRYNDERLKWERFRNENIS